MVDDRPWYREPESFVAIAALIVSISAVAVGLYEAHLQRQHDRAEVWPHLEVGTITSNTGVAVILTNSGIGPAVVNSIAVTVDGKPFKTWPDVVHAVTGKTIHIYENYTVAHSAIRAGDKVTLIGLDRSELPPDVGSYGSRIVVRVCYASVFDERWMLTARLSEDDQWQSVKSCPEQVKGAAF